MRVVGCFLEFKGRFVILLRHSHKPEGDTWGLPGGKVEKGESDEAAALRELKEETGYLAQSSQLEFLSECAFQFGENDPYTYRMYRVIVPDLPVVKLEDNSHAAYRWVTPEACDALPNLIPGFHEVLRSAKYIS